MKIKREQEENFTHSRLGDFLISMKLT